MTTELATSSAPVVAVRGDELSVSAATPNEMAQSQEALIAWAKRKIAITEAEAKELQEAYEHAVRLKYKSVTLKRHADLGRKRVEFYKKILGALEAGYIIVPSFPVEVFAVRTDRKNPLKLLTTSNWRNHEQQPSAIPASEGEYKNPFPIVNQRDLTSSLSAEDRAKGKTLKEYYAAAWDDLEFPINMAKPNIMEATERAMALKLFDDFGVLPGTKRNVDPIIVGRVKAPNTYVHQRDRWVSFIIAWHLDTATL